MLAFAAVQAALWSHAKTEARVIARDTAALVARSGVAAGDAQSSASAILADRHDPERCHGRRHGESWHRRRHGDGRRAGHHPRHVVVVLRHRRGPRRGAHPTVTPDPPTRLAFRTSAHRCATFTRTRRRGDRGSSDALGAALIAPAAIGLALVILFLGRSVDGRATVQSAAESAAQAAAQERSPAAAIAAAQQVGEAMLVDVTSCSDPSVAVDTSAFGPGGQRGRHRRLHGVGGRPRADRPAGADLDGDGLRHHRPVPIGGWLTDGRDRVDIAEAARRGQGDRGSGLVTGITLIFAFTFLGLVWLARDVDRSVSNRSTAQSIAFQAARSGAQAATVADLRTGDAVVIDGDTARASASRTATALFDSYGVAGTITSIAVEDDRVTVSVSITDAGKTVTGLGTVRSERAP